MLDGYEQTYSSAMTSFALVLRVLPVILVCSLVPTASAAPAGEKVKVGSATFQRSPGSLIVQQKTPRVLIQWQDFSIAPGEVTTFLQPSAKSIAVNWVNSGNPSKIYGSLEANGRVYLYNSSGILIGPGGQINAHQFVASTLLPKDGSFLKHARLRLSAEGDETGSIRNEGSINALGGNVVLLARNVENSGTISAPHGKATLAASPEIILQERGANSIAVVTPVPAPSSAPAGTGINNSGVIQATAAELTAAGGNIYALAINNGGTVRAQASTRRPAHIKLQTAGGAIQNSGTLSASGPAAGGQIQVDAGAGSVHSSGEISARGETADARGGTVRVAGDHITLAAGSLVDVSGPAGGGTALLGGGAFGKDRSMRNARETMVEAGATIRADALTAGDGGMIVLWSDWITRFAGTASARGGAQGGHGGSIETSSRVTLDLAPRTDVDASAPHGQGGVWLVDPTDITIVAQGGNLGSPFAPTGNANTINAGDIENVLNTGTSVIISTSSAFNGSGNIVVDAPITKTAGGNASLTLTADGSIEVNENIVSIAGQLDLIFQAGQSVRILAGIDTLGGLLRIALPVSTDSADIDLAANVKFGRLEVLGNNASVTSLDAVTLGASQLAGRLSVTTESGDIRSTATLDIGGNTDLTAGRQQAEGADISLTGVNSTFGPLALTGRNVEVQESSGVQLSRTDVSGNLTVQGTDSITQDNSLLEVGGTALFQLTTAGGSVTLDKANQIAGAISIASTAAAPVNGGPVANDVVLRNDGTGTLIATPASVRNLSLRFDNASITLENLDVRGTIDVHTGAGRDVVLRNLGNLVLGASEAFGPSSIGGSLTARSTAGSILQADAGGPLTVAAGATFETLANGRNILLPRLNLTGGRLSLTTQDPANAAHADVVNAGALDLGDILVRGRFSLTADGGGLTQSGALEAADLTAAATGTITLRNHLVDGTLNLTSEQDIDVGSSLTPNRIEAVANGNIIIGTHTVAGDVFLTADGDITQTGTLTAQNAAMTANGVRYGSTGRIAANAITVANELNLTSRNGITQSGAFVASLLTLSSGGAIDLRNLANAITTLGRVRHAGADSDFYLYNSQALTLSGAISAGDGDRTPANSSVTIRAKGDLILADGAAIVTTGAGNDIVLSTEGSGNFYNQVPFSKTAPVLDVDFQEDLEIENIDTGSRYIVYSRNAAENLPVTDPGKSSVAFGGLKSNWRFYNYDANPEATYDTTPPGDFTFSNQKPKFRGNGFVFSQAQRFPAGDSGSEAAKLFVETVKLKVFEGFDFNFDISKMRTLAAPSIYTTSYHVYAQEKQDAEKQRKRGLIAWAGPGLEGVRLSYDSPALGEF